MKHSTSKRILCVVGTRPEAIKMAPVILYLRKLDDVEVSVCSTGQHDVMLDQALEFYGVQCDHRCEIKEESGSRLIDILSSVARCVGHLLLEHQFDWVVVQGDTNSALAGALAAHYLKIPVAHVEAGLRTGDRLHPFPEETNRTLIADLADVHFAPTESAVNNLIREGVDPATVFQVGNTIVDAVQMGLNVIDRSSPGTEEAALLCRMKTWKEAGQRVVLVTLHRRETIDGFLDQVIGALQDVLALGSVRMIWAVHMNPAVRGRVLEVFGSDERVLFTEPLAYGAFLRIMSAADLVLSDSGGIQEEAPTIGVPVVVLRARTERPEGQRLGMAVLAGIERHSILEVCRKQLENLAHSGGKPGENPYGDGKAAARIADVLLRYERAGRGEGAQATGVGS